MSDYWTYQLLRYKYEKQLTYVLHEVYYKNGKIWAWTEDGATIVGNTKKEIEECIKMMERDARKNPVLDADILESESKKKKPNYEKAIIK